MGPYKEWVWLQEPGDYIMDQQVLPGGLFVLLGIQGSIYSLITYVGLMIFRRDSISTQ